MQNRPHGMSADVDAPHCEYLFSIKWFGYRTSAFLTI